MIVNIYSELEEFTKPMLVTEAIKFYYNHLFLFDEIVTVCTEDDKKTVKLILDWRDEILLKEIQRVTECEDNDILMNNILSYMIDTPTMDWAICNEPKKERLF